MASWLRNRAAPTVPRTASSSGSSTRSTAPPTSSTVFRSTRSRSRWRIAARCSRRSSTIRPATTSSTPPRAAAPSSTTGACASPSAPGCRNAWSPPASRSARATTSGRYMQMMEAVMPACAGLRRPGSAALDLCYVAAGYTDGFFENGLSPWDIAAGSLMVTEAGGLIGNFTGEADFLYQRECLAASPRIYGQLVALLSPVHPCDRPRCGTGGDHGRRDARAGPGGRRGSDRRSAACPRASAQGHPHQQGDDGARKAGAGPRPSATPRVLRARSATTRHTEPATRPAPHQESPPAPCSCRR